MSEIQRRISFGMGVPAQEKVDHPVLDKIAEAPFQPQRKLAAQAQDQLGTVGSGNHYVTVFEDETGHVWVGVHVGSRGFGHKTASGFLALAQGLAFDAKAHEGEMDSPPVLFEVDSELGQSYIEATQLAGEYAYAGRDVVVDKVLDILGTEAVHELYSTVHGAGRVMSRTQAAGKVRRRTVYACKVRDCTWTVPAKEYDGKGCPIHPDAKVRKQRTEELVRPGRVDWDAVRSRLREQGIVLIGGGADEAPEVYKRLPDVLDAHAGSIRVKHTLRPLGVAMAGRDIFDPYKDSAAVRRRRPRGRRTDGGSAQGIARSAAVHDAAERRPLDYIQRLTAFLSIRMQVDHKARFEPAEDCRPVLPSDLIGRRQLVVLEQLQDSC